MSILKAEHLEVRYENFKVFEDISLDIEEGKITTIIGPNGCGKSTLLKTLGRIIKAFKGVVYIEDESISSLHTKEIAKKLTLLPQNPVAPAELKVEELVAYGRFPHSKKLGKLTDKDKAIIDWAIDITKISEFRDREIGNLSGGQRQKVWLAMALAQETKIILLDEPTTYLDMAHQLEVLKIVENLNKEQNCTVVMVLHDINHAARFSHNIIAMKNGKIIASGQPKEIITKDILRSVFNIDAKIMDDEGIPVCYGYDTCI
jgi:iron complex transport system ATP-binding protein